MDTTFSLDGKKRNNIGILDIRSESVKFLIIKKIQDQYNVLGAGTSRYKRFGVFDTREFEVDVIKSSIKNAVDQAEKQADIKVKKIILGLSSHIFKAKISRQIFNRKDLQVEINKYEKSEILKTVFSNAQKNILNDFNIKSGITPDQIVFLSENTLNTKIKGYKTSEILKIKAKEIEFDILMCFLPKNYFENIKKIVKNFNFEILKTIHKSQGFIKWLKKYQNGLFLDIGEDFTQIFLVKNGILKKISEFKYGAGNFSEELCNNFGILYNEAIELKAKYEKLALTEQLRKRIKSIFKQEAQNWLFLLEKELNSQSYFENIFCFGKGYNIFEIKEALENRYNLKIKKLKIKDLLNVKINQKQEISDDYFSSLILAYSID
ncbi:MAG: hypothetical protein ISS87_00800 [Candidatus Pacebacteria bacterium]|nr:hypothetical protein [Candidatus Paceibacterota bacterium]